MGALTGQDTDRLPEEKSRGISVDLGFARLQLPGGLIASVVDVPGHERFVRNMVAGAYGIDLALLVVAADEGVMPQTREHLDIIDLLDIRHGVVALTKTDLVDGDLREMAEEEVREILADRSLAGADIVPVSALTGAGLDALRAALEDAARRALRGSMPGRSGGARLPVDRAFTVPGIGTVATGTLRGAGIAVGDALEVVPGGQRTRARSVQLHGDPVERAAPGGRVAINLPGLSPPDLPRGCWVAAPGRFASHRVLAADIRVLPGVPPLGEGDLLTLHMGTAEVPARLSILEGDQIAPGETGFARMHVRGGVPAAFGDRFILRRPSPVDTVAGGRVLDVHGYRYRRGRTHAIALLRRRAADDPSERILAAVEGVPTFRFPADRETLARDLAMDRSTLDTTLQALAASDRVLLLDDGHVLAPASWSHFVEQLLAEARERVLENPLGLGVPLEVVHRRRYPSMDADAFEALVTAAGDAGHIVRRRGRIAPAGHEPRLDEASGPVAERFLEAARASGMQPFSRAEAIEMLAEGGGEHLLEFLLRRGDLVAAGGFVVEAGCWEALLDRLDGWFAEEETLTVSQLRTLADTTRKYAVPLAETLDAARYTLRRGDHRYRGPALDRRRGPANA